MIHHQEINISQNAWFSFVKPYFSNEKVFPSGCCTLQKATLWGKGFYCILLIFSTPGRKQMGTWLSGITPASCSCPAPPCAWSKMLYIWLYIGPYIAISCYMHLYIYSCIYSYSGLQMHMDPYTYIHICMYNRICIYNYI